MQLTLKDNLPFVSATLSYLGLTVTVPDVLIDTGSARTVFSSNIVSNLQIIPAPEDILYTIRGVGGSEVVFARVVNSIQVGEGQLAQFEIEVGGMDYGFEINGILGMDFLQRARAVLNLSELTIEFE